MKKNNIDIFGKIDTEDKAYWLSFFGADGCNKQRLRKQKGRKDYIAYEVTLGLAEKDKEQVFNFREFLGSSNKITFHKASQSGYEGGTGYWYFFVGSEMLSKDLAKNGCPPRKTRTYKFPTEKQVSNKLLKSTVRGYFDGDGSIFKTKGSKSKEGYNRYGRWGVSILGTESYIKTLARKIRKALPQLNFNLAEERRTSHPMLSLVITGRLNLLLFLKWMYEGSTEKTRLSRKYELAMLAIKELEENSKELEAFGNFKLIIRSPKGKIFEVTESEWPSFAEKTIFKGSKNPRNKFRYRALRSGRNKKLVPETTDPWEIKRSKVWWEILNIKEALERKYPRGWNTLKNG